MRQRHLVQPVAQLDVEDAATLYENQRKGMGTRFVADFGDLLECIAAEPALLPVITCEIRRALMKRFPYAVYFTAGDQHIAVIAVLRQSRRPSLWGIHT